MYICVYVGMDVCVCSWVCDCCVCKCACLCVHMPVCRLQLPILITPISCNSIPSNSASASTCMIERA